MGGQCTQGKVINRNIGCIEMLESENTFKAYKKINRNIGCIEIILKFPLFAARRRLIET